MKSPIVTSGASGTAGFVATATGAAFFATSAPALDNAAHALVAFAAFSRALATLGAAGVGG